jgi:phosphodiesterase/alkaline phosphatase D-like protein
VADVLVLGPVLRHVGESTAQVWVQTERAATVTVLGCSARTFEVAGHHYALVGVTGLEPDATVPYTVEVDGEESWPLPGSPYPDSVIRTRGPRTAGLHRIVFGSCRYAKVDDRKLTAKLGIDALDAYAVRMATRPHDEWADALLLLGDQVYADELTPKVRRQIAGKRDRHPEWPDDEIVGYDEYAGLYRNSWADPEIRWIMSTVPTAMIFDDHDVRDDWNTSAAWRDEMRATSWWRERIRSGLASYWVYQHLGNLPPEELATDPDAQRILGAEGDVWPLLVELADRADAETDGAKGVRFSFRWDLGCSRFVMIDSRNGRILDDGKHLMLGDSEFDWVESAVHAPGPADGSVDHIVIGTSLPWLLPHAIGELQTVNEVAAARPGRRGQLAEAIRQGADLEHWPAFRESFDRLTHMIERAAASGAATVNVLSGDVHHSYAARADLPSRPAAAVHQLTCSPVHNHVPWFVKPGFRFGWSGVMRRWSERWARRLGAPDKPVDWEKVAGPLFGNTIATLSVSGRDAEVVFEQPLSASTLVERSRLRLTPPVSGNGGRGSHIRARAPEVQA